MNSSNAARPWLTSSANGPTWRWHALIGLLCAGVLVLLYSFVRVISQPHAGMTRAQVNVNTAANTHPLDAEHIASLAPPSAGNAARIENIAATNPTAPVTRSDEVVTAPMASAPSDKVPAQRKHTAPSHDTQPKAAKASASASASPHALTRSSDDVGLIEVVMTHASSRRIPPSAQESLKACAHLSEPEASACKAQACSQHPGTPPCME